MTQEGIMRRIFAGLLLSVFILAVISTISLGRKTPGRELPKKNAEHYQPAWRDRSLESMELHATALADTYVLAEFDFDGPLGGDPQGWYGVDLNVGPGPFFHVDDFAGLGGGTYGGLVPIKGSKSLWCGVRGDSTSEILCSYATLPGYGNGWYQQFVSNEISHGGDVTLEFLAHYDSEPGFDYTYVQYESKTGNWVTLISIDGDGDLSASEVIPADSLNGSVKLRFLFTSDGAWSDQDGLWDTDGAIVIDSLVVRDSTGVLNYQDFESESVGDTSTIDGTWSTVSRIPFGDYTGLFSGSSVLQEDPCEWNYSFLLGFFNNSPDDYSCGGHPEQKVVPYGRDTGEGMLYLNNEFWSPQIDYNHDMHGTPVPSTANETYFQFDLYADMPLNPLVAMIFHIRSWQDNCPGYWKDRAYVDFYDGKKWMHFSHFYADLVDPGAEYVQLALGAVDMYPYWYIIMGNGDCHRHSPLYDNVRLIRIDRRGPRWSARSIEMFQDTFPENGTGIGTGRIDIAEDILYSSSPSILPGDSACVSVTDPVSGLRDPEPYTGFGSAVYFYMRRDPATKPMQGDKIVEDSFRWPLVDSVMCDSRMWYVLRCDTAFTESGGPRTSPVPDRFCIDINDHYFTNGDTIWYFFGAENSVNQWTWWTLADGVVGSIGQACASAMEMQILPAGGMTGATDILYVDDFDGQGAQPYFDSAFEMMGITPDRYDVLYPRANNDNSPSGRVTNVIQQLIPFYRKIIWNTGSGWYQGVLDDGDGFKSDDYILIYDFLDQHTSTEGAGVYLSGDDVAYEWDESHATSAGALKTTFINHNLVSESHQTPIDYGVSPLVIGEPGLIFDHVATGVDTMIAFGGCPEINDFDVLEPLGTTTLEMTYNNPGNPQSGAVIANSTTNSQGNPAKFVLSGFSYHYAYDDIEAGIPDRVHHLTDIIRWLGNDLPDPTIVGPLSIFSNSLSQNYPNPFNPVTTLRYSIKERAHVSLKVYNVAGRLVKTLVNEIKQPGLLYKVRWEGRSNSGNPVASGVYFYKIVAKDFSKTKKMVLLK
jgi:hypothetical protein